MLEYSQQHQVIVSMADRYFTHILFHVIRVYLPSRAAGKPHNQEIKPTNLSAPREFLCLSCFIIIQSCYFNYRRKKIFTKLLLNDLHFVLCSLELDVLRAQRIMGFLCYYPQISEVGKSNHMFSSRPTESATHIV